MISNISNSNQQHSTPSFQAKMRSKDIRAMKNFYKKELKNTSDPNRMDRITEGCQNFAKFLDKIGEGDKNFTLEHSRNGGYLLLSHNKDKNFSTIFEYKANKWNMDSISYYNKFFSQSRAKEVLEYEKVLNSNYEKKQKSSSFLSKLFKKF